MFQVTVFCEDVKLQKVMWALDGIVVGMPQVIPVRGAKASPDKKQVVSTTAKAGGTIISRIKQAVWALSGDETTTNALAQIGIQAGAKNRQSAGTMIATLIKQGLLKRIEQGKFTIVRN